MDNLAEIPRTLVKIAMRSAWVHTGALRAPVCIQGEVMAMFARVRGISTKLSMKTAWVRQGPYNTGSCQLPEWHLRACRCAKDALHGLALLIL